MDKIMPFYNTTLFPRRLKRILEVRNMTRQELAQGIGWDNASSVSQYLVEYPSGKNRVPKLETLCRIANAVDCDIEYLLGVLPDDIFHRDTADVCAVTGLSVEAAESLIQGKKKGFYRVSEFISILLEYKEFMSIVGGFYDYMEAQKKIKPYEGQEGQHPIDYFLQKNWHDEEESKKPDVAEYRFSKDCVKFLHEWQTKGPIIPKRGDK